MAHVYAGWGKWARGQNLNTPLVYTLGLRRWEGNGHWIDIIDNAQTVWETFHTPFRIDAVTGENIDGNVLSSMPFVSDLLEHGGTLYLLITSVDGVHSVVMSRPADLSSVWQFIAVPPYGTRLGHSSVGPHLTQYVNDQDGFGGFIVINNEVHVHGFHYTLDYSGGVDVQPPSTGTGYAIWRLLANGVDLIAWDKTGAGSTGVLPFDFSLPNGVVQSKKNPNHIFVSDAYHEGFGYFDTDNNSFVFMASANYALFGQSLGHGKGGVTAIGFDNDLEAIATLRGAGYTYSNYQSNGQRLYADGYYYFAEGNETSWGGTWFGPYIQSYGLPNAMDWTVWRGGAYGVGWFPTGIVRRPIETSVGSNYGVFELVYQSNLRDADPDRPTAPVYQDQYSVNSIGFQAARPDPFANRLLVGYGGEPYLDGGDGSDKAGVYSWDGRTMRDVGGGLDWGYGCHLLRGPHGTLRSQNGPDSSGTGPTIGRNTGTGTSGARPPVYRGGRSR